MEISWGLYKPVLLTVFKDLTLKDLASSTRACKTWKLVADSDPLWQIKCSKDLNLSENDPYLNWKEWYRIHSKKISFFSHYHLLARDVILVWDKCFYLDDISNYQQRGMQKDHVITSGHTFGITCTHALGNEVISQFFTGSFDKSIKIWARNPDSRKFECIQTLAKHNGMITAIASNTKFLFSGSSDCSVNVWRIDNEKQAYTLHQTLTGHTKSITSIECFEDGDSPYLFTSSKDKTIIIWKNTEGNFELFQTLTKHESAVNCMELIEFSTGEMQLISGDNSGIFMIWKEQQNKLWSQAHVLSAHTSPIATVCFNPQLKSICTAGGKEAKSWNLIEDEWTAAEKSQETESMICNIKLGHYAPGIEQSEIYLLTEQDLHISWLTDKGITFTDKTIEFPQEDML